MTFCVTDEKKKKKMGVCPGDDFCTLNCGTSLSLSQKGAWIHSVYFNVYEFIFKLNPRDQKSVTNVKFTHIFCLSLVLAAYFNS